MTRLKTALAAATVAALVASVVGCGSDAGGNPSPKKPVPLVTNPDGIAEISHQFEDGRKVTCLIYRHWGYDAAMWCTEAFR